MEKSQRDVPLLQGSFAGGALDLGPHERPGPLYGRVSSQRASTRSAPYQGPLTARAPYGEGVPKIPRNLKSKTNDPKSTGFAAFRLKEISQNPKLKIHHQKFQNLAWNPQSKTRNTECKTQNPGLHRSGSKSTGVGQFSLRPDRWHVGSTILYVGCARRHRRQAWADGSGSSAGLSPSGIARRWLSQRPGLV